MTHLAIKAQKWFIWGALAGIIYLLRDLFPVIFLTFTLSYIGNTMTKFLTKKFPYRRFNLTLAYFVFITILLAVGSFAVPRIFVEARDLARHYIDADSRAVVEVDLDRKEGIVAEQSSETIPHDTRDTRSVFTRETTKFLDKVIVQTLGEAAFVSFKGSGAYDHLILQVEEGMTSLVPRIISSVKDLGNNLFKLIFHFILAVIFSFLIIWDLPRLGNAVAGFAEGRSAEVYEEIAPGFRAFGLVLGKAFEAQSIIALNNALLTAIGFAILGIPSLALLSTIVFFCSYIPVLGVILSTFPAALLAVKVGGVTLIFKLVAMVMIVHAIETYLMNPFIYGHHLRIHPVGVLVILLVGEHLFGVWGMILGVPVSAFILRYVIEGERRVAPRED